MAVLTGPQRSAAHAEFMRELSKIRDVTGLTKPELRLAINAVDQWLEDNRSSYNQALPVAARTGLTAIQKSRLLTLMIRRRFGEGA